MDGVGVCGMKSCFSINFFISKLKKCKRDAEV